MHPRPLHIAMLREHACPLAAPATRAASATCGSATPLPMMFDLAAVARPAERPAVFLDKDGTLIVDLPYSTDPDTIRFTPDAPQALRRLAGAGFALIVVTNQAGLATGRLSRQDFAAMQRALEQRVLAEAGVPLDGWFTCPHSPGPDGAPRCLCRKPAAGLLRQARTAHGVDLARSWMVGDVLDDVEAGRRAGCRTILLDVGNETAWRRSPLREPPAGRRQRDRLAPLAAARARPPLHDARRSGRSDRRVQRYRHGEAMPSGPCRVRAGTPNALRGSDPSAITDFMPSSDRFPHARPAFFLAASERAWPNSATCTVPARRFEKVAARTAAAAAKRASGGAFPAFLSGAWIAQKRSRRTGQFFPMRPARRDL
jgi:D-glycero-D-manno-heptose 1,7-bisphosphate phosphatase